MVTIKNFSGLQIMLDIDGTYYYFPVGTSELKVADGVMVEYTDDYSTMYSEILTEWGTVEVSDGYFSFEESQSPTEYFMVGVGLALSIFATLFILKIVKNVGRETPDF